MLDFEIVEEIEELLPEEDVEFTTVLDFQVLEEMEELLADEAMDFEVVKEPEAVTEFEGSDVVLVVLED